LIVLLLSLENDFTRINVKSTNNSWQSVDMPLSLFFLIILSVSTWIGLHGLAEVVWAFIRKPYLKVNAYN
jgi:hypothetical protein